MFILVEAKDFFYLECIVILYSFIPWLPCNLVSGPGRSYNDLDAPEEEFPAVDHASLQRVSCYLPSLRQWERQIGNSLRSDDI